MPWLWRVRIVGRSDGFESATSADSNKTKYGNYSTRREALGGYPLSQAAKSKGAREQHWSMWMVRCPGCARWQELREFRFGGTHHHWKPARRGPNREGDITWDEKEITEPLLNTYRCNSCFAKTHGRQELGKLSSGLHDLQTLTGQHLPWKYSNEWSRSMQNTPCLQQDFNYILKSNDITMLKFRREKCRYIWERIQIKDDKRVPEDINALYDDLGRIFDECEEHWKWLQGCGKKHGELREKAVRTGLFVR
uniref:Uncharacterized protein n=1 Tax=Fusarium oxysporum (strain Fo5176) TaxID=660025 RepID=A0A0D2YJI1_FUSOF